MVRTMQPKAAKPRNKSEWNKENLANLYKAPIEPESFFTPICTPDSFLVPDNNTSSCSPPLLAHASPHENSRDSSYSSSGFASCSPPSPVSFANLFDKV
jgi:hypothetical protein